MQCLTMEPLCIIRIGLFAVHVVPHIVYIAHIGLCTIVCIVHTVIVCL